jgi:NhaP-type Na+/H+ or K+/H+ antiporter
MELSFAAALLVGGGLLALAAALSGVFRGTILSVSVLGVTAGVLLAATGAVDVNAGDRGIVELVELALIVTLFSDGLLVDRELLAKHWSAATRALALAMPLTLGLLAVAAKLLFSELSWAEAFLLAAVLSPTDPVVTSAVVKDRGVPASIRHTLNLESGLNDGLALPFVLFFIILASPGGDAPREGLELLGEAGVGALIGVALGMLAGKATTKLPMGGLERRYDSIYALGVGLLAFGLAEVTFGNGFIAVFTCGITLGIVEHDIADDFEIFSENLSTILSVLVFFLFGALIVGTGYSGDIWLLAGFALFALLVARPLAVFISFLRVQLPGPHRAFIAWFGPKGVASMLFALFVLKSAVDDGGLIFEVAAFTILASIIAHGLTDTVGARWIESRISGDPEKS